MDQTGGYEAAGLETDSPMAELLPIKKLTLKILSKLLYDVIL